MKNIYTCDDGHYNVQQKILWSRIKQENKKVTTNYIEHWKLIIYISSQMTEDSIT